MSEDNFDILDIQPQIDRLVDNFLHNNNVDPDKKLDIYATGLLIAINELMNKYNKDPELSKVLEKQIITAFNDMFYACNLNLFCNRCSNNNSRKTH